MSETGRRERSSASRDQRSLGLRTDDGRILWLPEDYLAHAHHGYALTGHVSQGATVDRTFILASPERGGAEWAYVAASRHRLDLELFVTHHAAELLEESLARAWLRSRAKHLALDLVDPSVRDAIVEQVGTSHDRATPERLLARVEDLRAARESAREVAASVTNHELARVVELRAAVARAEEGAGEAEGRRARLDEQFNRVPAWRRSERAEARSGIERARTDRERHRAEGRAAEAELTRLGPALGRLADAEGARLRAHATGDELNAAQERLGAWGALTDRARGRSGPERVRDRPSIDRDLGRGR